MPSPGEANQATTAEPPSDGGAKAASAEPPAAAGIPAAPPVQDVTKALPTPAPDANAESSAPFLQDLVAAMRRVAEEARDKNLSELRTLVEKRVEQVSERGAEQAEDLRRRSELDIKGIGDWERSELERIRAEAERKVEARRKQLEQQLHDHQDGTEHEVAGVRTRLADHERELELFFTRLGEIKDPSAFVAAAKRMPTPPSIDVKVAAEEQESRAAADGESLTSRLELLGIDGRPASAGASANGSATPAAEPAAAASLQERLAELDEQLQAEPGASAETQGAKTAISPSATPTPPAEAGAEVSTPIVVKGLGSFGAITSFKQSLEKVDGIRSVTLSLGPTGEFVYRAAHDPDFDVEAAIGSLEGGSAELERQGDGTLRVAVNRAR